MGLSSIISNTNNEVRNIILGFLVEEQPKTADQMHEELSDLLKNSEVWIPAPGTIHGYLYKFQKEGIVDSDQDISMLDPKRLSEQSFYITDKNYSAVAQFLLRWAVKDRRSIFSIFGHSKNEESATNSSIENRVTLLHLLSWGEKTLMEICNETSLNESVAFNNLRVLEGVGLIKGPEHNTFEGNSYEITKDLREYFESRLPPTIQQVISAYKSKKSFTVNDIHKKVKCGRERVFKSLLGMESEGILVSEGKIGMEKTYSISPEFLPEGVSDKILKYHLRRPADKRLFKLFKENGFNKGGKLEKFKHSDLYKLFEGSASKKRVRDHIGKLESGGYVLRTIDCKADKAYRLSDYGNEFWNECLIPVKQFFEKKDGSKVMDYGPNYFSRINSVGISVFLENAMHLYELVSPYLKRTELNIKSKQVMQILIERGELSRQELLQEIDTRTRDAISYLREQGRIRVEKRGPYHVYIPTKRGIAEYSPLL